MKALIVDDSRTDRAVLNDILTSLGASVVEADCGTVGIETANKERFDVVFMDMVMGDMNGASATKRITTETGTPVIMCSSQSGLSDMKYAEKSGAKTYILKPATATNVQEALRKVGVQ